MEHSQLEWWCIPSPDHYLIMCSNGGFEVGQVIDKVLWSRAIDRCLLLRRAVQRNKDNMQEVMAAIE